MRLDLDTEVRYPTGELAGVLRRVALDANNQANYVVMATEGLISRNVIVPVDMLEEGPGGVLTILATREEVDALPDYEESLVPAVSEGWEVSHDAAPGGDVFPATVYEPNMPVVEVENLPIGSVSISQGTEVSCLDGRWGVVDEVLLDDKGEAYAFVTRPDDIEQHDRIVPIALVQQVDANSVLLNCTLADLPTYTQETVNELEEPDDDSLHII
jgi:hypothetical protein